METPFSVMLLALVVSAGIAFLTGRALWGFLPTALAAAAFASYGATKDAGWSVGLFLMACIPYGVISLVGVVAGRGLRESVPQKPIAFVVGGTVALVLILGIVGAQVIRSHAAADWDGILETDGKEYTIHLPQVVAKTGPVREISVRTKTAVQGSERPYASVTYYVQGATGKAIATVGLSGTTWAPRFALLSVESSP